MRTHTYTGIGAVNLNLETFRISRDLFVIRIMRYHWPFRVTSARCLSGFTIVSYNKQLSSSVITAFGRLRQEDHEFEAILGLKPFWNPGWPQTHDLP
jgi:hypothetical protein